MTSTNASEFFLHYAQHVLGLRQLPVPVKEATPLLILDIPWPSGLGKDEMFQKMMAAVDLAPGDFDIFECLPSELPSAVLKLKQYRLIFSFSRDLGEALFHLRGTHPELQFEAFVAAGPRDLRLNPTLKRETWEQLKQMRSRLKES